MIPWQNRERLTRVTSLLYPNNTPPVSMRMKSVLPNMRSVPLPCGRAAFSVGNERYPHSHFNSMITLQQHLPPKRTIAHLSVSPAAASASSTITRTSDSRIPMYIWACTARMLRTVTWTPHSELAKFKCESIYRPRSHISVVLVLQEICAP